MCYDLSLMADRAALESRYEASFVGPDGWRPTAHANAFSMPFLPIVIGHPRTLFGMRWGLVPRWTRDSAQAADMGRRTANARAETVFEKPAFRESARTRRCLVPVTGFFETRHEGRSRYPYFIKLRKEPVFSLAGVWAEWEDPAAGSPLRTFSVLTTEANPMMAEIHNTKRRMPVILDRAGEKAWLDEGLSEDGAKSLFHPFDERKMTAHTVSRVAFRRGAELDPDDILRPFEYPELETSQSSLF